MKHWQRQHRLATEEGELRKIMKKLESETAEKKVHYDGEPLTEKPHPYVPLKLPPDDMVVRTAIVGLGHSGALNGRFFNLGTRKRYIDRISLTREERIRALRTSFA